MAKGMVSALEREQSKPMAPRSSSSRSGLGRVLEKARDFAAQVHHTAEKLHRQAEETRRLSGETRRRSEQTRELARSNRRETDATSGSISQGLAEAAGAARVLSGESEKPGEG